MKKFLFAALLALLSVPVQAQSVQQSGSISPGHVVCWVATGVVKDCGTSTSPGGNALGLQATSSGTFGVKNASSATNPTSMTFGVTDSAASITVQTTSGSNLPLNFVIQGVTYAFPTDFPIITQPYTAGGVVYAPTTTTLATSSALTSNHVVIGGGISGPSVIGAGTATTLLHGNASGAPSYSAVDLTADVTGTLPVTNGGTGAATLTNHGVVLGQGTSAVAVTSAGTSGQALVSGGAGADPSFGTVSVPGGGTGIASGTSGGVPYFASSTTMASSGALTADEPVIGGGAGVAPTVGTRSGNTTIFGTVSGALTSGNCLKADASGNIVDQGTACGASSGITIGTTTIASGTDGRVLFDNAGVVGEKTVTGTGSAVLATSPTLVTPALGTPSALVLTNATGLPLTGLASQAADTFLANATSGSAAPTAVALSASQLAGRGSSGDIAAISLGTGLSMSGTTLSSSAGWTLATPQATTSGTTKDFTSIPSTARVIKVQVKGVSTNNTGSLLVQIGTGSGVETSAYVSGAFGNAGDATSTSGFIIANNNDAARNFSGVFEISLENSSANTWTGFGSTFSSSGYTNVASGYKSLSGTLDRVRLTSTDAATFDAGEVNVLYQ